MEQPDKPEEFQTAKNSSRKTQTIRPRSDFEKTKMFHALLWNQMEAQILRERVLTVEPSSLSQSSEAAEVV